MDGEPPLRLPDPCVVVLVGPPGAGKSTWAARWFGASEVLSSDALRGVVGTGEHDQQASADAFDLLQLALERRCRRRLTTVVDSQGTDAKRRRRWLATARAAGLPCVAVAFDVEPAEVKARNRRREGRAVPAKVVDAALGRWPDALAALDADGFDAVVHHRDVRRVHPAVLDAPALARRQQEDPVPLAFGLHLSRFAWPGGAAELGPRLAATARLAEEVGFSTITVMDHVVQIPQVGRAWEDLPESTTTMGFLAAATTKARLGVLVNGITYRNVAHLGKATATLDVLSGGRALCGLGAAWFAHEHAAYGWAFPPLADRYALLEDALELLPLLWGPGSPAYRGRVLEVPEAVCYPRPLAGRVPILVGGGGERRTLRLVARHADACNLAGEAELVARKVAVLRRHCEEVDRDPDAIEVTSLGTALVADDAAQLDAAVRALDPHDAALAVPGTVEDHVGRCRALADAGVRTAIVALPDVHEPAALERFAEVITAFR